MWFLIADQIVDWTQTFVKQKLIFEEINQTFDFSLHFGEKGDRIHGIFMLKICLLKSVNSHFFVYDVILHSFRVSEV